MIRAFLCLLALCLCACTFRQKVPSRFYQPVECRSHLDFENGRLVQKERVFRKGERAMLVRAVSAQPGMQRPDLSSLKTRLASNALTSLQDLIEAAGAANVRSVILTFDDKQEVHSIVVEFPLHPGMGGLELRKTTSATTVLSWNETTRQQQDESVSVPKAGSVLEFADLTTVLATLHGESAAAKIFNHASFPKEWNVTHSHAARLQMTLVRIQPDYGCSEHRLKRPYCIQWQFDNEVTHLLYRRPDGRVDADFWTWP